MKNAISRNFQHFGCHFIAFLKQFKHLTVWPSNSQPGALKKDGHPNTQRWSRDDFVHTFRAFRGIAFCCVDKLRSAQNPWFVSCGTSIHTSQSRLCRLYRLGTQHELPECVKWVKKYVRLVSVLLRKHIFLRTLNRSSSYRYWKHHHFVTQNFRYFMTWDLIDTSSFSSSFSSSIWDLRWADPKSWKTSVKSAMEMLFPGLSCRQTRQTQPCQTAAVGRSGDVTLRDGKRFRWRSLESGDKHGDYDVWFPWQMMDPWCWY